LVADKLGSGMLKMMKYGKVYGAEDPELIEGDLFRMVISVPEFGGQTLNLNRSIEAPVEFLNVEKRILNALSAEPLGRRALLENQRSC
jgi:predicted HTH transcriptional regulator